MLAILLLSIFDAPIDPVLGGWYHSFDPAEGKVTGVIHVTEHEGRYLIAWLGKPKITDDGKFAFATLHGRGIVKSNMLAVGWGGPSPSVGLYEIRKGKKGTVLVGEDDHWFPIENPKIVAEVLLGAMVCVSEPEVIDWKLRKVQATAYPHLPTDQECAKNYHLAQKRRTDAVHLAITIGYLSQENGLAWCGGGWHAEGIKAEIAECERLEAIWWACWYVQWPPSSEETRKKWAEILRGLVGADDYWSGSIPVPYPPRRRVSFATKAYEQ